MAEMGRAKSWEGKSRETRAELPASADLRMALIKYCGPGVGTELGQDKTIPSYLQGTDLEVLLKKKKKRSNFHFCPLLDCMQRCWIKHVRHLIQHLLISVKTFSGNCRRSLSLCRKKKKKKWVSVRRSKYLKVNLKRGGGEIIEQEVMSVV